MADTQVIKSHILIVDDEEDHAQVMCEALQRLGHRCDVTYNLPEARSKLDRRSYDVVVTDLVMDGKRDGLEVLKLTKEKSPPHNLTMTVTGAGLLWFGWFGFNAGSALGANGLAALAFVTTHVSAGSAAMAWVVAGSVLAKTV